MTNRRSQGQLAQRSGFPAVIQARLSRLCLSIHLHLHLYSRQLVAAPQFPFLLVLCADVHPSAFHCCIRRQGDRNFPMSSISPTGSYSTAHPQDSGNAYKYEDPTAYQIQSGYPSQFEVSLPVPRSDLESLHREPSKSQGISSSEPKVRLRKACDSCSVRKVKVCARPLLCVHARADNSNSVTRQVRPANHAPPSISRAHLIAQVGVEDPPTGMRRP